MKNAQVVLLFSVLMILFVGCYKLDCTKSDTFLPEIDPKLFVTTPEFGLGVYQDVSHDWKIDEKMLISIDEWLRDTIHCLGDTIGVAVVLTIDRAQSISEIDESMFPDGQPSPSTLIEYNGKNNQRSYVGTLPSDFRIVLTKKDVCLANVAEGYTVFYKGHPFIWINQFNRDLLMHEFVHELAYQLHLSAKEEQTTMKTCVPDNYQANDSWGGNGNP